MDGPLPTVPCHQQRPGSLPAFPLGQQPPPAGGCPPSNGARGRSRIRPICTTGTQMSPCHGVACGYTCPQHTRGCGECANSVHPSRGPECLEKEALGRTVVRGSSPKPSVVPPDVCQRPAVLHPPSMRLRRAAAGARRACYSLVIRRRRPWTRRRLPRGGGACAPHQA